MNGKLTLITPPDIWENENKSILLVNLTEKEQDSLSQWLSDNDINQDLNLYLYEGQPDMNWLFHAMNVCDFRYLNLNNLDSKIIHSLSGYILGKNNSYYKLDDENLAAVYKHINLNRINSVENFFERILIDQAH